jgi:hypothetical protein
MLLLFQRKHWWLGHEKSFNRTIHLLHIPLVCHKKNMTRKTGSSCLEKHLSPHLLFLKTRERCWRCTLPAISVPMSPPGISSRAPWWATASATCSTHNQQSTSWQDSFNEQRPTGEPRNSCKIETKTEIACIKGDLTEYWTCHNWSCKHYESNLLKPNTTKPRIWR